MLYYLIQYLEETISPPGFQAIQFITVRASLAGLTALIIALFGGRYIINWLSRKQLGEQVREGSDAGIVSHAHKAGTPTMGGVIILLAILGSTLLWGAIAETYVWLIMLATAWMGVVGFLDDYIKNRQETKGRAAGSREGCRPGRHRPHRRKCTLLYPGVRSLSHNHVPPIHSWEGCGLLFFRTVGR